MECGVFHIFWPKPDIKCVSGQFWKALEMNGYKSIPILLHFMNTSQMKLVERGDNGNLGCQILSQEISWKPCLIRKDSKKHLDQLAFNRGKKREMENTFSTKIVQWQRIPSTSLFGLQRVHSSLELIRRSLECFHSSDNFCLKRVHSRRNNNNYNKISKF